MDRMRRAGQFRDRVHHLDHVNNEELIERYRLSRDGIQYVCDLVRDDILLQHKEIIASPLSKKVLNHIKV